MIKKYSLQTQGILLALFAMLTFSINDGIFKYTLQFLPMETVTFTGYFFSLIFLLAFGLFRKNSFLPLEKKNGLMYGALFLIEQTLFIYALKNIPIAELFVVVLSTPIAVLILSSTLLKEHLFRKQVLAVIFGFAGAFIVVAAPFITGSKSFYANASVFAWSAAFLNVMAGSSKIIYLRKYCQNENSFSLSFISILFVTIFYFAISPSNPLMIPAFDLTILFAGGCIGAFGCIAYINAFQMSKAALISATQYSQIVWAVMMGFFIFHERLTAAAIAGSLLIITSGYFLYLKKDNEKSS